jgi:hypothetical protein
VQEVQLSFKKSPQANNRESSKEKVATEWTFGGEIVKTLFFLFFPCHGVFGLKNSSIDEPLWESAWHRSFGSLDDCILPCRATAHKEGLILIQPRGIVASGNDACLPF